MEDKTIKLIILTNRQILVSQIEEVGADIGEPDCRLVEPFILGDNDTLSPWLANVTSQNTFMMSSDKILTLADPKPTLLEKYQNLIK
jgi:glutamate 5-kinase